MKRKTWFDVKAGQHDISINIHDEIGAWGIGAAEFISQFKGSSVDQINVSIHSRGGNMLDAVAMYHELQMHRANVSIDVPGIAASAATLVMMAGNDITMPEDAWIMIHNPWAAAAGDSHYMRDLAEHLEQMQASMINIYHARTGIANDEIRTVMDNETWLNGVDALAAGWITSTTDPMGVAALAPDEAKHYSHLPAALAASVSNIDLDSITDPRSYEAALRDAGCSKAAARALTAKAKTLQPGGSESREGLTALLHSVKNLNFTT